MKEEDGVEGTTLSGTTESPSPGMASGTEIVTVRGLPRGGDGLAGAEEVVEIGNVRAGLGRALARDRVQMTAGDAVGGARMNCLDKERMERAMIKATERHLRKLAVAARSLGACDVRLATVVFIYCSYSDVFSM